MGRRRADASRGRWARLARAGGAASALALLSVLAPTPAHAGERLSEGLPPRVAAETPAADPVPGPAVLEGSPDLRDLVAEVHGLSATEADDLLSDETTLVTQEGRVAFVDPVAPEAPTVDEPPETTGPTATEPLADTFALNSKPGSNRTIYLDTDGQTISNTAWAVDDAGPFDALPYDTDGTASFSAMEMSEIQKIWQLVAEDFAPFDVNVTTQDPGLARLRRDTAGDTQYGVRVMLTSSTALEVVNDPAVGGVAFFDAFDAIGAHDQLNPAWAFIINNGPQSAAFTVSHEVGHTLGLRHDGTASAEYYTGHGVWAPIMGLGGYRAVGQWSKGEYAGASNTENDFSVMAQHGVAARPDDHTDATTTATTLAGTASGLITTGTDKDLFRFVAPASGATTFAAKPGALGPNLDIKLTLLSAGGTQLAQANPAVAQALASLVATGLDASITHTVVAGTTYYVRVEPTAHLTPSTGYSTYGSIGPYQLTASSQPTCTALDTLEPNDSLARASAATSGVPVASRLCTGDVDYFAVPAVAGEPIDLSLAFTHAQGDLDLRLFKPSGPQAAASAGTDDGEVIDHVATETGPYLAEVSAKNDAANTYSFTMTSDVCPPDDSREDDDTFATAKPATTGVQVGGISCPDDDDRLSIAVTAGQRVEVQLEHPLWISFVPSSIVDSAGNEIDTSGTILGTDKFFASATATRAETWNVLLQSTGGINGYRVRVTRTGGPSAPGAPTGVTVTGADRAATVRWTAPTSNGGSSITGYTITPYVAGVAQSPRTTGASARSLAVTGLTNGPTHHFRVTATNAAGTSTLSSPSPSVVLPFATLAAFIQRQSQDLRGRPATTTEESTATYTITAGTLTAAGHIASLRTASDATTHVDPTARLYFAYFRRVPDAAGLNYWIGLKRGGRSLSTISSQFAAAPEFRTIYGSLDDTAFVTLVYQNVLGRSPATAEVTYWTGELTRGKTRGAVMIGFSESPEYRNRMRPSVDVAVTWIAMLGARPDTTTFNTWVTSLTTGGKTTTDLATYLLADPRYTTRVT